MKVDAAANDPSTGAVVEVTNPSGAGDVLLVCEHASNFIPPDLGNLGLDDGALASHIAWDPGALAVAQAMSRTLDAPLVAMRVSRLVYDCNRPPEAASAVAEDSEIYRIPGNTGLDAAQRLARADRLYRPFCRTLATCLDSASRRRPPVLVTIHSFTPVYHGTPRTVEIGILHDADARFADAMLRLAAADGDRLVRRNEPYGPEDGVTHTLAAHALPRGLLNVMIEIRNDLVASSGDQQAMAARLSRWVAGALAALRGAADGPDRA
ncbi:MAG: N-formylglutamate amidohydrolase [Rhodospirillaceae bacterium]|nr:N-formylglutamate amidohydrolase [Rhodospirillaceae bacterium]